MKNENVPIRRIGIPIPTKENRSKPLEGKDFPAGIEHLDLGWFERSVTVEALAGCRNELERVKLQNDAQWILDLRRLKEKALEA